MRQIVQSLRSGEVEVLELPDPAVRSNQVLVRTTWSLISPGTEQAVAETAAKSLIGKARDRPEEARKVVDKALTDGVGATVAAVRARLDDLLTPGYSSAGVVEAVGEGVEGLRVGDRVGCVGANAACHAERVVVPAPLCLALPDSLDDRWGAFGALGAIAAHGVRTAEVEAGSVVCVVGLGLVGQLAAQLATAAGARVIAADPVAERVELAGRLGAAAGAVLREEDAERRVDALSSGEGADAVLLCAATGDSGPIELAAAIARERATVCVVGDVGLEVPRAPFYAKELQLRVSRSYGPGRYDPAYEEQGHDYPIGYVRWTERRLIAYFFEEVAAGRVRLEDLVTHEFPIELGEEAYAALSDPSRLAILLRYGETPPAPSRRVQTGGRPAPSARPSPGRAPGAPLRVGVVGPGLFARSTLLPALRGMGVELAAVAGGSPARAFGAARRWEAGYSASEADEVIAAPSIDVVVIATRHDSHAELAARALERGKGVFLEKPLAIDDEGLARVRPLLEDGARLVLHLNRGFAPSTARVGAHFGSRSDPLFVQQRVNAGYVAPDHWWRDPSRGGGRVVGEGCHFVDLSSALVRRPLATVQATALGEGPGRLAGDSFLLTLRYADGSLSTVAYVATGAAGMAKERLEALGGGRSAVIDDFRRVELHDGGRRLRAAALLGRDDGGRRRLPGALGARDKGHRALLAAAMRFFREGGPPPIPYERLVETTRATFIARAALAEGREAPVPLEGA